MTSKEAKYDEWRRYFFEVDKEMYEYFIQDLERLEMLELNLDSEKYHLVNDNHNLKNRVEDLEICYKAQIKENEKLKKAIEILKDKIRITVGIPYVWLEIKDNCLYFKVNQQEYDLLKEVLGND